MVSTIFTAPFYKPFEFTWDRINNHKGVFSTEYNHEDAQILLQLSIMVTETNYYNKPLNVPSWLNNIPLLYKECPLPIISQGIKNTPLNDSTLVAHIFYNDTLIFVIFTGTINGCLVGLDLSYGQVELDGILNYSSGLRGHRGIYLAYQSIRSKLVGILKPLLSNTRQLVISGHSLGGALSQLCALDMAYYNPIHYSFASPMVFNDIGYRTFSKFVKCSYRVANISDLIVISPLPVMPNKDAFYHVGDLMYFQRNLGEYSMNHSIAYLEEYNLI